MRKIVSVCTIAFLVVCGLSSAGMAAKIGHHLRGNPADHENSTSEVMLGMDLSKNVFSDGETYEIDFDIIGSGVKSVKKVTIKTPKGKKMDLKNTLGLNDMRFEAGNMSYEDYQKNFPEGKYSIMLSPKAFGSETFDVTHDFPVTPVITSPVEGATDVPLTFTIEWESLADEDIDGLFLDIEDEAGEEFEKFLTADETSFTIPADMLQANTQYEIGLAAYKNINDVMYIATFRVINITTAAEVLVE